MMEEANREGANAVIGVRLDYETIGSGASMLMICASGTAVTVASTKGEQGGGGQPIPPSELK